MLNRRKKPRTTSSATTSTDTIEDTSASNTTSGPSVTTTTTSSTQIASFPHDGFTAEHFSFLSRNENYRYMSNSKRVGHAVFTRAPGGGMIASQFAMPVGSGADTPAIVRISDIEPIVRFGMTRYRAKGPDGKRMFSKRFKHGRTGGAEGEAEFEIAYFSEEEKNGKEPFWGSSGKPVPLISDKLTADQKKDLDEELEAMEQVTKGGPELTIDHPSVRYRDANNTRKPDQNTVMGQSAKDAYEEFMDCMMEELSEPMKRILKRAIDAPLRDMFKSNYRPEWLHLYGFSLTPSNMNPQTQQNLGSSAKWVNTEMMVLERIAKWFALNRPESIIKIRPLFEMLWDTELVKHVSFQVSIEEKQRWVRFIQELSPFVEYPLFPKASDLAQATGITFSYLHGIAPVSQQKVAVEAFVLPSGPDAPPASTHAQHVIKAALPDVSPAREDADAMIEEAREPAADPIQPDISPDNDKELVMQNRSKATSHLNFENSLVQIYATSQETDYSEPWRSVTTGSGSGTGVVFSKNGKKYILTNAHVVENNLIIRVRVANDRKKKYEAKAVCVSYQCDLAVLEVDDPQFLAITEPAPFGEMVKLEDEVQTMGFPMGGDELSTTRGIVSRIEVGNYSMSNQDLLQVQVDAGINPGNSGGPVFSNGKVIGIAFQIISRSQNIGYMIPMPIVNHFISEVFSSKEFRGFPIIPYVIQTLENSNLREYYGMGKNLTGVRITSVDNLSDAFGKLKRDDIILEIDGLTVSNEGTVDVPGIGKCLHMLHVTQMKFIGDTTRLKILRKNPETGLHATHDIDVTLDTIQDESEMAGPTEHDVMPTYYINSGIAFCPLTPNYLEDKGSDLAEVYILEQGCTLGAMPKKKPGQQFITINNVFDCADTEGYQEYIGALIKEINGVAIDNIHDVVRAMENNPNDKHIIHTVSKKVIVVENMSPQKHAKLLKHYKVPVDRSDNLIGAGKPLVEANAVSAEALAAQAKAKAEADAALAKARAAAAAAAAAKAHAEAVAAEAAALAAAAAATAKSTAVSNTTASVTTALSASAPVSKPSAASVSKPSAAPAAKQSADLSSILPSAEPQVKRAKPLAAVTRSVALKTKQTTDSSKKRKAEALTISSDEEIAPSKQQKRQTFYPGAATPGQSSFMAFLDDLGDRVNNGELADDDEDEFEMEADDISSSSSSESEEEAPILLSNDEDEKPANTRLVRASQLFKPAARNNANDADNEKQKRHGMK